MKDRDPAYASLGKEKLKLLEHSDEANLVTSLVKMGKNPEHMPVLDIDVPIRVVPSSTPGKSHLYIDVVLTKAQYDSLMNVLCDVGIIEDNYYKAYTEQGFSCVRLPWVRKGPV
jgi:hypothetical protein